MYLPPTPTPALPSTPTATRSPSSSSTSTTTSTNSSVVESTKSFTPLSADEIISFAPTTSLTLTPTIPEQSFDRTTKKGGEYKGKIVKSIPEGTREAKAKESAEKETERWIKAYAEKQKGEKLLSMNE